MASQEPFRVIMWCVPRSISTAIAKCCSFIENTQVWFEPYCMAFFQEFMLKGVGAPPLPRRAEDFDIETYFAEHNAKLTGTPLGDWFNVAHLEKSMILRDSITKQLNTLPSDKSVFIKDMSYGITNYLDLLPGKESGFKHIFLIRDPERMFPSWRNLLFKQMGMMTGEKERDVNTFDMTTDVPFMLPGYMYKCQYDLWKYVKENIDPNPVVIDVDEMLADPAAMLPKLFQAAGMPYTDALLQWDPSPEITQTWRMMLPMTNTGHDTELYQIHGKAMESSSFAKSRPKIPRSEMTPDTIKCIDATVDYYNEMAETRIK